MFRLVKSETKPLTIDLAREFNQLMPAPVERNLDTKRVNYLRERADAGTLVSFNWARVKLGKTGEVMRVNGQHSSTMLSSLNGNFPKGLYAHIDDYEVENEEGMALLFRQFDARQSGRSIGDVAGAYQNLEPALREIPKPIAKLGMEGLVWQQQHAVGVPVLKGDERFTQFSDTRYHPFLQWLGTVFSIKTPELKSIPVVAAMYGTHDANPKEAEAFWNSVARGGVEYDDTAPATVLDAWLKEARERKRTDLKPANYYQGCIYAWNAHRKAQPLNSIKFDTKKGFHAIED